MATSSTIGKILPNGKIIGVYCHSDGYLDGVGKILIKHYTDPKKVDELIKLGKSGISYLGTEIGEKHKWNSPPDESWTGFYGRDRSETGGNYETFEDLDDVKRSAQQDFTYIFNPETKTWQAFDGRDPVTIPGQKVFSTNKYDAFFEESVQRKNKLSTMIRRIIKEEVRKIRLKEDIYSKEIAQKTGTRIDAVDRFLKTNEIDSLTIIQGLGSGKINKQDFVQALLSDEGTLQFLKKYNSDGTWSKVWN